VPFSLFNPYTETLKLDSRLFQIGDRSIKVQQHWQPGGRGGTDIGFGASVYDCSIVLSYFLSDVIANEINGHSVIELGCGKIVSMSAVFCMFQFVCGDNLCRSWFGVASVSVCTAAAAGGCH
jgi:hypothetical protein